MQIHQATQLLPAINLLNIPPLLLSLSPPLLQSQDMIMRMMARNSVSENLQQKIDNSVKKIATEAYEQALTHIR